jgi:MFS family permease
VNNNEPVTKLWNGTYILLNLINIITNIGFSMITTTISLYTVSIGASLAIAGTVASVFSLAALMVRPISGAFVDKYNKNKVFVLSSFLFGSIVYGYALVKSIPMLFALRILHGILFGISSTANMALASRFLPKKRVAEGMGYFSAGMMIGQAIGPAIGIDIKNAIGFSGMYTVVALCISLPPLACLFINMPAQIVQVTREKAAAVRKKFKFSISDYIARQFLMYALVSCMFSFYNGIANSFMVFIGEERNIANISLFFTISSIVLLAVRILTGRISDKKSLTALVNFALVFTVVSMACVGAAASLQIIIVAAVLKAVGQGTGFVSLQGEALRRADAGRVGVATSTMYIGNDIGNTAGPILGGLITQSFGYSMVFTVSIGLVAAVMIAFNLYQKKIGYQKPAVQTETP